MQEMSSDFRELFALLVLTIKNTTRGEDMYQVLKQYLLKNDDDVRKPISVTTDGAPSMVGRTAGLVVLLKADEDFPNIHSYHCIIHQEALRFSSDADIVRLTNARIIIIIITH